MANAYAYGHEVLFEDRRAAGRFLGMELQRRGVHAGAVLGLTRGGVPVAYEVAAVLGTPLDLVVVKKLRAPASGELAIGAVCADGTSVLHPETIRELDVTQEYVDSEFQVRLAEAQAAERSYRDHHIPLHLTGIPVVLVDDGIATGATMEAAIRSVRKRGPSRVVVAVPVGSNEACMELRHVSDEVICMATPRNFWAVGQFYRQFAPVPDDEVRSLLAQNRATYERWEVRRH
ncbi:MAG: phosphoribosyltransferase [Chloroflexi bacterium]|nr:phosphoribosyltransferase [Chloroflexota bacterium]